MPFFVKFRNEVGRFSEGMHELPAGANDAQLTQLRAHHGRRIDMGLEEFLRTYNGVRLFFDSYVLWSVERLRATSVENAETVPIGEANESPLFLRSDGRVLQENDEQDLIVAGSDVEHWLLAVVARDALLFDQNGEYLAVFDDDEVALEVRKKRVRVGRKRDPGSAAWVFEAAELALELGDEASALLLAEEAAVLDKNAGEVWQFVARLSQHRGDNARAEIAFAAAAHASRRSETRALRFAEAARVAALNQHSSDDYRRQALAANADCANGWITEATAKLATGEIDSADELAGLAHAIDPKRAADVCRQIRIRRSLRTTV